MRRLRSRDGEQRVVGDAGRSHGHFGQYHDLHARRWRPHDLDVDGRDIEHAHGLEHDTEHPHRLEHDIGHPHRLDHRVGVRHVECEQRHVQL
jgi:hypothetical protein